MRLPGRWLDARIAALDPETEYAEVLRLLAEHRLTRPAVALTLLVTNAQAALPPAASATLVATRKLLDRPDQRLADGTGHLLTWLVHGPRSDEARASVERLNRLHLGLARKHPGAFDDDLDFVYQLCAVGTFLPRMRATLGLAPQDPALDVAWHHFLRDLADHFRSTGGPVAGFPQDMAGMLRLVEDYEARPWPPTDTGRELTRAMVEHYASRFFPPPMRWFGRAQALVVMPARVRAVHRTGEPRPAAAAAVRVLMRLVLRAQDTWWPDRRRRFSDRVARDRATVRPTRGRRAA
ncbi:hypothetical protein [Nocardioides perillae]|uniref:ER-bound oxygenase mpaB/mpaB'/Rubber oxygenase catalytic domain-containing protein n=1 Tax=Nocardioides perillae TaxID=1119534 RepID=A0A7Y9RTK2_9ACTN|nr:hypothetical protein [Nocardioides perillae]NYG53889.1 hypothetical protein [Nocardioides perillae]